MKYDIIIIGAGAAGLLAMRDLAKTGYRVCMLEASGIAGGRISGIKEGFENYVEITGVQFGAEAESSFTKGGGASIGKPIFDVIAITKSVDKLSNELLKNLAIGKAIPLIEIATTRRTDQGDRVGHKIELKNVFIQGYLMPVRDAMIAERLPKVLNSYTRRYELRPIRLIPKAR